MAKDKKKKGFIAEFKEFALQGNLFDMAVGVIIGGVFKDLVGSFTNNVIMPIISIFTGGVNFDDWKIKLPTIFQHYEELEDGTKVLSENYLTFGTFLSAVISFLILMLVVFLMVKGMNKLREKAKKKKEEEPEPDPEPSNEEKLLTEIRDLLKNKQ